MTCQADNSLWIEDGMTICMGSCIMMYCLNPFCLFPVSARQTVHK